MMLSSNLKFSRRDDTPLVNSMLDQTRVRRAANDQHHNRRQ
jgi:hypothetical protein